MSYLEYQSTDLHARTSGASPVSLMIVMLDGLQDEIARARAHIENRRSALMGPSLQRCRELLGGLTGALDLEAGGEVAHHLARLYEFCSWRLTEAEAKLDATLIDSVVTVIDNIAQGWRALEARHA